MRKKDRMADIKLMRTHFVPLTEARARVQKAADELAVEHNLRTEWRVNVLLFERPGLHGEIRVSPSDIQLEATLGLLMKPLRGTLVAELERKFEELFPESKPGSPGKKRCA